MRSIRIVITIVSILAPSVWSFAKNPSHSASETLLVRASELGAIDFQAIVRTQNAKTVAEKWKELPTPEGERISQLLTQAQQEFLSGSLEKSKELFVMIQARRFEGDWSVSERNSIFYSLMRLAQLLPNEEEVWLRKAIQFAPDQNADETLFPPPMVQRFRALAQTERANAIEWNITRFRDDFEFIRVNGRIYDVNKGSNILLPAGQHRVTFLSSLYWPSNHVMNREQIISLQPGGKLIAPGSCGGKKSFEAPFLNTRVIHSENCLVDWKDGKSTVSENWSSSEKQEPDLNRLSELPKKHPIERTQNKPEINPWVLTGLGAAIVVGAIMVINSQKPDTDKRPTHQ